MYCYGNTLLPNNNKTLIAAQRPFKYVVRDTYIEQSIATNAGLVMTQKGQKIVSLKKIRIWSP